ncbi:MAG: carbohydrate-binding domain-containing protein, partial [Oscillospiraceae bacterium]|nr:carbohydrate-binding domain-containing protein [Oscillospiraceae bacterium]
ANGNIVTISAVGSYVLSGELEGQVIVNTGDDAMDVTLVFEGVSITDEVGPVLWIQQAKDVHLQLARDSENLLRSGKEEDLATFDASREGAALYAEDDLKIEGSGKLTIQGYRNNGITCKDDLDILDGSLLVQAANNGIRASESLDIRGGAIAVQAGNDGLKTSSAEKDGKGWIRIRDGAVTVDAQGDGISAETDLFIEGGSLSIAGGQAVFANADPALLDGRRALKAKGNLTIQDGTLMLLAPNGDGIRAGGEATLSGGTVVIQAGDDGIQTGGQGSGVGALTLSGSQLFVCAENQALKCEGGFAVNGGRLLALADSGKQMVGSGSQPCLFASVRGKAGDSFEIQGADWLADFRASYDYKSLLYSDETLKSGETVTVRCGDRELQATA